VCALATGNANEAAVINARNKAIAVAVVLIFENLMYFYSPRFYERSCWLTILKAL
jgi:hypothetical protein